ncbi:hypothetical protein A3731_01890 [Roseovarius sp. HI0049]|nr:hypothetical protein A3731_01890 [Roseovarius sp. HI0049]
MTFRFLLRAIVLTCLTVAGWLYIVRQEVHWTEGGEAMTGCEVAGVMDARTVRLNCEDGAQVARLAGLDVPDMEAPGCEVELAHGALGRDRLKVLLEDGGVEVFRLGDVAEDGAMPVRMTVADDNVADRLVREGLAAEAGDGATVNWCDRLGALVE